jgi:hypothetical protein
LGGFRWEIVGVSVVWASGDTRSLLARLIFELAGWRGGHGR